MYIKVVDFENLHNESELLFKARKLNHDAKELPNLNC